MGEHPVTGLLVEKFGVNERTARRKSTEMTQTKYLHK
jgi:hypothetical protein